MKLFVRLSLAMITPTSRRTPGAAVCVHREISTTRSLVCSPLASLYALSQLLRKYGDKMPLLVIFIFFPSFCYPRLVSIAGILLYRMDTLCSVLGLLYVIRKTILYFAILDSLKLTRKQANTK